MPTERREARRTDRSKLIPEPCADGLFKGYVGLDRIGSANSKLKPGERMSNLVHHINEFNLHKAFRQCDGNKAVGIDQVTKKEYGKDLQANISRLFDEIYRGGWRPKPARQVMIPKPQGGFRPLAIGCLEDKIFQTLLAKILEAVYEPVFSRHSFGFRHGKNAHQALARLYQETNRRAQSGVVVEMDIEKFFDTVNHDKLMELLGRRIADLKLLRLIRRALRNSILAEGGLVEPHDIGTPQGSPVSPVLANIYLHYVLDEWFDENWRKHGEMVRYADDAVFMFNDMETAELFREALIARMGEYGLKLNLDKSGMRAFDKRSKTDDLPFLGFALYWGKGWARKPILKVKTHPKKLARGIQAFTDWIKENRHRHKLNKLWSIAKAKIIGHYNYYGVSHNLAKLNHFYYACIGQLFKWLNRRSQKRSFTWEQFQRRLMFNPIPAPTTGALIIDIENGLGTERKRKPKSRVRKSRKHGSVRSGRQQCLSFT
jgi:RNA-directed DNA polymerase